MSDYSFSMDTPKPFIKDTVDRLDTCIKRVRKWQLYRILLLIFLAPGAIGLLWFSIWAGKITVWLIILDMAFIVANIVSITITAISIFKCSDYLIQMVIQQQFFLSVLKELEKRETTEPVN